MWDYSAPILGKKSITSRNEIEKKHIICTYYINMFLAVYVNVYEYTLWNRTFIVDFGGCCVYYIQGRVRSGCFSYFLLLANFPSSLWNISVFETTVWYCKIQLCAVWEGHRVIHEPLKRIFSLTTAEPGREVRAGWALKEQLCRSRALETFRETFCTCSSALCWRAAGK